MEAGVRHCRIMVRREVAVSVALDIHILVEVRRAWTRDIMRKWGTRMSET